MKNQVIFSSSLAQPRVISSFFFSASLPSHRKGLLKTPNVSHCNIHRALVAKKTTVGNCTRIKKAQFTGFSSGGREKQATQTQSDFGERLLIIMKCGGRGGGEVEAACRMYDRT